MVASIGLTVGASRAELHMKPQ